MTDELVALHLKDQAGPGQAPDADSVLKPIVDNLLRMVCEMVSGSESAETAALRERIADHRRELSSAHHPQEARIAASACVKTCEQYLRGTRQDYSARETELTEMIAILRQALARFMGDSSEFQAQIVSSADRLGAMSRLDDIRDIKRQIADEVKTLQQTVRDKQQKEQQDIAKLSERVKILQEDLSKAEEEASHDALTKIPNRGNFDRTLARMIQAAATGSGSLCLAMLDIDHFKKINDTHGHMIGDRVLLCAAEGLQRSIRQTDFIARYGGEEFAIILVGTTIDLAADRLEQILAQIASRTYDYEMNGAKNSVRFTLSCGVTQLTGQDEATSLIGRADQALYEAKRKGRNRVVSKKVSLLGRLLS